MASAGDEEMRRLTEGLPTKSAKIRKLGSAGYSRQQIADFLGIRYQHVRNVLVDAERILAREGAEAAAGLAEERGPAPAQNASRVQRLTLEADGSVRLPGVLLGAAGMSPGDVVIAHVAGDGEIHLLSRAATAERARAILRKYIVTGTDLTEELLQERALERQREERLFRIASGDG
jgi:bifunctional DNA-binding transcriptional regulator/antitoxin component of YhaV-PrlF toxin-antitoxin module